MQIPYLYGLALAYKEFGPFSEASGAEASAAAAIAEARRAANAGMRGLGARALLDCARHSMKIPDLKHPTDLVQEALAIALVRHSGR